MGKKVSGNKRGRAGNGGEGSTEAWTSTDHAIRKAKQMRKLNDKQEERQRRSRLLTRDSKDKREEGKLRLHTKRVQRQIDALRKRLQAWDDQEEARLKKEQIKLAEKQRALEAEKDLPKKRKPRPGPETWKLKGAARPASQVYDFDTRYVDPHVQAHEEAKRKAQRVRNLFSLYKGRFGEPSDSIPEECREFLALLMQHANLSLQAKQYKTARQVLLECLELDSDEDPITPARCHLMKLYLEVNRPESARRLWERLSPNDPSVWIRYSAALIEFVSWKVLEEENSTQETATALLVQAIRSNAFCAYYLAFWDSFQSAMDYVDEIEDATDAYPLEEAIEYCNHEQGYGAWQGTEGALEWIKRVLVDVLNGKSIPELSAADLDWKSKLDDIKKAYLAEAAEEHGEQDEAGADHDEEGESGLDDEDDEDAEDDEPKVDGLMFAGMFETAMEMLEGAGGFKM